MCHSICSALFVLSQIFNTIGVYTCKSQLIHKKKFHIDKKELRKQQFKQKWEKYIILNLNSVFLGVHKSTTRCLANLAGT